MKTLPLLSVLLPATSSSTAGRLTIDETLEGRARRGDRKALEALLREHARTIHDVCRYIVGFDDAHDATQEALERIVTAIHQYDPAKGAFRTWALTVTRNLCRDRLRRRGLERRTFHDPGEAGMDVRPDAAPGTERVALARIETERLAEALQTLPDGMRLAVVLFHVHEASYEEIASTLEVPAGTVMTWLHRGRRRLREALADDDTSAQDGEETRA